MNGVLSMEGFAPSLEKQAPLERALAFLASRSKNSARELSVPASEVFQGFRSVVDQILTDVIQKRTAAEFRMAFAESFPKYMGMTLALSHVAHLIAPNNVIEHLTRESICELEADFRDKGLAAFGASVRDQAMFTVWTLRKINDLLTQISAVTLGAEKREEDMQYCLNFNVYALRAQFGLDALSMALRLHQPIYPEVMEELKDSLRGMVNAYAWARRGAAVRLPVVEPALEVSSPDQEEEELLRASMQDLTVAAWDEDCA